MEKINEVMELVGGLTDEDFEEVQKRISNQLSYTHPFKLGKVKKIHDSGEYNQRVLEKLKELKEVLAERIDELSKGGD